MTFSNFEKWIIGLLKPEFESAEASVNQALVDLKPEALAFVGKADTTDIPALAGFLSSKIPTSGIFGGIVKSEVSGFLANLLGSLSSTISANDGAWYDELVALVKEGEAKINL
jgi:hypothetical protein